MRFARHAAIFRGPLDAAAVASVLFLMLAFLLVSSLLYTPGVLVRVEDTAAPTPATIVVTRDNEIIFAGKTNQPSDLASLREDLRNFAGPEPFGLQVHPGASPAVVEKVRELFQVHLPAGNNLVGTDNPTVIVAVNFRGQCFFENKPVDDAELREDLLNRLHLTKKLTLVLVADKGAGIDVVMRLSRLAKDIGITDILIDGLTDPFGVQPGRPRL